jgi:uncharacterized protein YqeY
MQERPPVTLSSRLQTDLTTAIRDRDELRRDTLRMAIAAAYNESKRARRDLTDDEVVAVLTREVKTRRESIEAFSAAGRTDAADKEQAEVEILAVYLPQQLTTDEIAALVNETVDEVGASSPRDMGKVMAALVPKTRGRADGKAVSAAVAQELAARDLAGHDSTGHGH